MYNSSTYFSNNYLNFDSINNTILKYTYIMKMLMSYSVDTIFPNGKTVKYYQELAYNALEYYKSLKNSQITDGGTE